MTVEKRGTGADYGQEVLRDRAKDQDTQTAEDSKKKLTFKKKAGVAVAVAIAVAAGGAILFSGSNTPAQQVEQNSVEVNENGVPLTKEVKSAANTDDLKAVGANDATTPAVDTLVNGDDKKPSAPENNLTSTTDIIPVPAPDVSQDSPASSQNSDEEKAVAVGGVAEAVSGNTTSQLETDHQPESLSTDYDVPVTAPSGANATVEDLSRSEATSTRNETPGAAPGAQDKPKTEFEPEKFGLGPTSGSPTTSANASKPQHSEQNNIPVNVSASRTEQPAVGNYVPSNVVITASDLNYTGKTVEVTYKQQEQNTLYLYGNFAAKVFLLPSQAKDSEVKAYLTDQKGWEVSLLPGNILRINKKNDPSITSAAATDLFIVNGSHTYSLILQSVGEPDKRTDSMRYMAPKNVTLAKAKK